MRGVFGGKRSERGRGGEPVGGGLIYRAVVAAAGWAARRVRRVARRGGMLAAGGYRRSLLLLSPTDYCSARGEGEGGQNGTGRDGGRPQAGRGNNGFC